MPMLRGAKFSFPKEMAYKLDPILQKYPRILDLYHTLITEDENGDLKTLREQAIYTDWVRRPSIAEWQSSPAFVYNLIGLARLCSTYVGLFKNTDFPLFWESARSAILSDQPIQIDLERKP